MTKKVTSEPIRFAKDQILSSEEYANRRDLLSALLDDGKEYTKDEVNKLMNGFLKSERKVK